MPAFSPAGLHRFRHRGLHLVGPNQLRDHQRHLTERVRAVSTSQQLLHHIYGCVPIWDSSNGVREAPTLL